eukprot:366410-Chlamydomonas_euryale.AAC.17
MPRAKKTQLAATSAADANARTGGAEPGGGAAVGAAGGVHQDAPPRLVPPRLMIELTEGPMVGTTLEVHADSFRCNVGRKPKSGLHMKDKSGEAPRPSGHWEDGHAACSSKTCSKQAPLVQNTLSMHRDMQQACNCGSGHPVHVLKSVRHVAGKNTWARRPWMRWSQDALESEFTVTRMHKLRTSRARAGSGLVAVGKLCRPGIVLCCCACLLGHGTECGLTHVARGIRPSGLRVIRTTWTLGRGPATHGSKRLRCMLIGLEVPLQALPTTWQKRWQQQSVRQCRHPSSEVQQP